MGGDRFAGKISAERAISMTNDERVPFEVKKKYYKYLFIKVYRERLFSLNKCYKLEKNHSEKDFDNALRFLKLRSQK
jgi:hypothetical protein